MLKRIHPRKDTVMVIRQFRHVHVALLAILLVLGTLASAAGYRASTLAEQTAATPMAIDGTPQPAGTPLALEGHPAWLQIGPGGALTARTVSSGDCPTAVIDGVTYVMAIRAVPSTDHPMTVCETSIPAASGSIAVGGTQLQLPSANPKRILVLGDTGCRMKEEDGWEDFQACNDPAKWPFASVAEEGVAWQPDLIVHVGDYIYRESPCPAGNTGCAGSPYGDTWAAWNADFFTPAASLLAAAPWVFVRGNHEDCSRGGDSWFRYLDPRPLPTTCQDYTDPYAIDIGDHQAVVLDTATAQDTNASADVTDAFRPQFAMSEQLAGDSPAWLLTHRPLWSIGDAGDGTATEWTTATYAEGGLLPPPAAFDLVLAGHVHSMQLLWFTQDSARPVEVIPGNGGTALDPFTTGVYTASDLGDETLVEGRRYHEFGFAGLERTDTGWVVTNPMVDGTTPVSCLIVDKAMTCIP